MAHFLLTTPLGDKHKIVEVYDADETVMGAWINGTSEADGRWLLKLRIPCYIVHELDTEMDWHHGVRGACFKSFVTGTSA